MKQDDLDRLVADADIVEREGYTALEREYASIIKALVARVRAQQQEIDTLKEQVGELEEDIADWQASCLLGTDPDGLTPGQNERQIVTLRAQCEAAEAALRQAEKDIKRHVAEKAAVRDALRQEREASAILTNALEHRNQEVRMEREARERAEEQSQGKDDLLHKSNSLMDELLCKVIAADALVEAVRELISYGLRPHIEAGLSSPLAAYDKARKA